MIKGTSFLKFILLVALGVALIAPFTFLKQPTEEQAEVKKLVTNTVVPKAAIKPKVIEKPLHNVKLPDFAAIKDVKQKKQRFFDFIRPAIVKENNKLLANRAKIEHMLEQTSLELPLTKEERSLLKSLAKRYRVNKNYSTLQQIDELLMRVDVVPLPLVMVQAANESAWGTSRFARIGLNFFGIWCYREGCGMVPSGRNTGAKHEVAAFKSVDEAVSRYFYNINTNNAYMVFRTIRAQLRDQDQRLDAEVLATGLLPYSERGADYVLDITDMLRHNQEYFTVENEKVALSD